MEQGRHYRWMAGSGRIDRTPELIKPFQENVPWIQQPVHLPLVSPCVANDKSTAICHRVNIRKGCGICHQPLSQTVFTFHFILRTFSCSPRGCTWSCWCCDANRKTKVRETVHRKALICLVQCVPVQNEGLDVVRWQGLIWKTNKIRAVAGDRACENLASMTCGHVAKPLKLNCGAHFQTNALEFGLHA